VGVSGYLTPAVTFGIFLAIARKNGEQLSASTAFTSLSLISLLGDPLSAMFAALPQFSMTLACFGRIQKYLLEEERDPLKSANRISKNVTIGRAGVSRMDIELESLGQPDFSLQGQRRAREVIVLDQAAFGTKEGGASILQDLNLCIYQSSLTMIIGRIGSGKSTLLKGIIGELPATTGSIHTTFTEAAYCDQQVWLINDTVQNNILGQSSFEARWYQTIVNACALDKDFSALPLGDRSVVGSKGISLSGGQRARVVSFP